MIGMVALTLPSSPHSLPLRLGYVPLIDCAPILVARERGLFQKHGIEVVTSSQPGWATIREKLVHGEIDAAQCLGPLALAIHHGIGTLAKEMVVPLILSGNGNGITLSTSIPEDCFQEEGGFLNFLKNHWDKERPLTLASVHPCSSHHLLLMQWLRQQGVAGHQKLTVISLPPEIMMRNLSHGHIDGFCVGEPWNSVSSLAGYGYCIATSVDLSNGHPEKVLASTLAYAESHPQRLHALTLALLEACKFCQEPANRPELIEILSTEPGLSCIREALDNSLSGHFRTGTGQQDRNLPDFHIFHDDLINAPSPEASSWLREGLRQSGLIPKGQPLQKDSIFRMDLYRNAQKQLTP